MARSSGLKQNEASLTLLQKLLGGVMAGAWSRSETPPLGPGKDGFYEAALKTASGGDTRAALCRCLLLCDAECGQWVASRLPHYREAFAAFPGDERCAFFVTALLYRKAGANSPWASGYDADLTLRTYESLLRPEWVKSPLWARYDLAPATLTSELARLYSNRLRTSGSESGPLVATESQIAILETALMNTTERGGARDALIASLCRIYRGQNRMDADAQSIYGAYFNSNPDDRDNTAFLASLWVQEGRSDAGACTVFARQLSQADIDGNDEETSYWTLRLAHAYIAMGRLDEGALITYRQATLCAPDDILLHAAMLCAAARLRSVLEDETILPQLEHAIAHESDFTPVFAARRWDWGMVVRALALAWGHKGRVDIEALDLYARATLLCPEDRTLWILRARALSEAHIYDEEAQRVYEKAQPSVTSTDDPVNLALGRTYVATGSGGPEGNRRREAIQLWENLYRQGIQWPGMLSALAQAYTGDDRVNDVALSLWEKEVEADASNGILRLRLGREWKLRSDVDTAVRYYCEAARLLPTNFEAQFGAGALLKSHFSDNEGAVTLLRKAITLEPEGPTHLEAHFTLGEALFDLERRSEAKEVFQTIIDTIDANHTETLLRLARLNLRYEETGIAQAEALYGQAMNADPNHPETYRKLADLYREKGQVNEEQEALEKYLSLCEPDASKYRQLADLYIRRGDFLRAEGALRQIITLGQGDKKLYTLLGEVILQAHGKAA